MDRSDSQQNRRRGEIELTGRTFGDILDSVLDQPRRWLALFLLVAAVFVLLVGASWAVTQIFGLQASQVTIGGENTGVVFEGVQKQSGDHEYVVVVSPQGWQNSGIDVNEGDTVTIHAGGKICIDMDSIWQKVHLRHDYEDQIAAREHIRQGDPSETRVPEDYFTPEQKRNLILDRPWVDPDGFDLQIYQPSFRSRRSRYLMPDERAGGLVGAISSEASEPKKDEVAFLGKQKNFVAPRDGQLWFTVNDVRYNDPANPNLFYNDNIGSFWARVIVKKKK